jgi:hypothetical protein
LFRFQGSQTSNKQGRVKLLLFAHPATMLQPLSHISINLLAVMQVVKNGGADLLQSQGWETFGDIQKAIDLALQRYTIEQVISKLAELRQKNARYQIKYGVDYPTTFTQRVAEDEKFVHEIEANISKTWEIDLADWEFCYKGIEDWTRTL